MRKCKQLDQNDQNLRPFSNLAKISGFFFFEKFEDFEFEQRNLVNL